MKIELKKFPERKGLPNDKVSIEVESKFIDLEIERRNRIQSLVDSNYNNRKYCEEIFSMYDISFESDYSDVIEFMKAKKGTIKTTVPYDAGHYRKNDFGGSDWINEWTYLSYDVAYYDIDLEHVYSKDELELLVKTGKVVLLKSSVYKSVPYQWGYVLESERAKRDLPTLENYDFNNLDNNGIDNNQLVIGMVRSKYDIPVMRKELSEINSNLLNRLNSFKNDSLQMKGMLLERVSAHETFAQVCDEKILKLDQVYNKNK